MILVTGGAGFIGSNFILHMIENSNHSIINLDKLTYSSNLSNLSSINSSSRYKFIHGDILDRNLLDNILRNHNITTVINFAAESHVDRSIHFSDIFIKTNVLGVHTLLDSVKAYFGCLDDIKKNSFKFIHISTDEVFGSLDSHDDAFTELSPFRPNSPYSASKAASDHLCRAWYKTYNIPVIITNCSNNYGPYQFPEKLIPLTILNALDGKHLPIYGNGMQIRDWIYVEDHCRAIRLVVEKGLPGSTYNIGSSNERTNIEVVNSICSILDDIKPCLRGNSYKSLIRFVTDRAGHDHRYAVNSFKIRSELGWEPSISFDVGITKTIGWYLNNLDWIKEVKTQSYDDWIEKQYS